MEDLAKHHRQVIISKTISDESDKLYVDLIIIMKPWLDRC